mgnify:FL=1
MSGGFRRDVAEAQAVASSLTKTVSYRVQQSITMKFALKHLALAASLVSVGLASAQATTIATSGSVTDSGYTFSALSGTGTLSFSSTLIGALNAGGIQVSQVNPAIVTTTTTTSGKYKTVSAAAPVTSLTGAVSGSTFGVTQVATAGGALQTAVDDGFTTTGGSLSITNLMVDLSSKKVFATLIGANGVGTVNNLYLWDIGSLTGATSQGLVDGTNTFSNTLSGLKINSNAFNLFSQALGLTAAGNNALSTVTDFGTITSTISFNAKAATAAVPEPSTYALMGLGLAAVGMVARRRAK